MDSYNTIEKNNKLAYALIPEGGKNAAMDMGERNLYRGLLFYMAENKLSDIVPLIEEVILNQEAVFGMTIREIDTYNEAIMEENRIYNRNLESLSRHAALYFDGFNSYRQNERLLMAHDLLKRVKESKGE